MNIKYETIKNIDKNGDELTETYRYIRIIRKDTIGCCLKMQKSVDEINSNHEGIWSLSINLGIDKKTPQAVLVYTDYDGNDSMMDINHCPACGKKIESEEIKVSQKITEKKYHQVTRTECENLVNVVVEFDNTSPRREARV